MAKNAPATMSQKELVKQKLLILGIMLAVLWGVEIIDTVIGEVFQPYGIRPREAIGLLGLVTSPLLHADFTHLMSNTVPFAVLGFFVMLRGMDAFVRVTLVTAVVGGLCVWLVAGSNSNHIGASGVIFGYFGYLIGAGVFERSFKSIAAAVLVGLLYGGIIFGVFPGQAGVSWEGHLFGFLAGGGLAWHNYARGKGKGKSAA